MNAHDRNQPLTTDYVKDVFRRSIQVKAAVVEGDNCEAIVEMAKIAVEQLSKGGKILLCGNGGSAADAQHLAAELLVRLRPHVNRESIPALALALDTSSLTACGNDYSYEVYFQRMVEGLGREEDIVLGITTSGNSKNVILALQAARVRGMKAFGFLGGDGGPALKDCDKAFIVPSTETGRIQEAHITAGHALMELIEEGLLANKSVAEL